MRKLTDEDKLKIVQLYKEGKSSVELGQMFNCSDSNIRGILRVRGVEIKRHIKNYPRKYSCNEAFFDVIDNERKAYWLGFIFGDGNVHENTFTLNLMLSDHNHLALFKNHIQATNPVKLYKKATSFNLYSEYLVKSLSKYNIIPRKTYEIDKLPLDLIPFNFQRHFLRGLFDADGHSNIVKNGKGLAARFGLTAYSDTILNQIKQWFLDNYNIMSCITLRNRKGYVSNAISFNSNTSFKIIYDIFYSDADTFLERKYVKNTDLLKQSSLHTREYYLNSRRKITIP